MLDPEAVEAALEKFGPPNSELAWHQTMLMAWALRSEIKRAHGHVTRSQYPAGAIQVRSRRLSFTIETLQIAVARLRRTEAA
jgi:hypothetical protein